MSKSKGMTPPLSPVLLAGMAMRALPTQAIQPVFTAAMRLMHQRHPGVFERMADLNAPVYKIDPVDLPFVLFLDPHPDLPALTVSKDPDEMMADATIRGPLMLLIDLLEGRIDGDALFFSRDLIVEGDTEAVVALRNAVDGEDISVLSDALSLLGPLSRPAEFAVRHGASLFGRFGRDLETLRDSVLAPVIRRVDAQGASLREMEDAIQNLRRDSRRRGAAKA